MMHPLNFYFVEHKYFDIITKFISKGQFCQIALSLSLILPFSPFLISSSFLYFVFCSFILFQFPLLSLHLEVSLGFVESTRLDGSDPIS